MSLHFTTADGHHHDDDDDDEPNKEAEEPSNHHVNLEEIIPIVDSILEQDDKVIVVEKLKIISTFTE